MMLKNASARNAPTPRRLVIAGGIGFAAVVGAAFAFINLAPLPYALLFTLTVVAGALAYWAMLYLPMSRQLRFGMVAVFAALGAFATIFSMEPTPVAWIVSGLLLLAGAIGIGREIGGY